jgi:ribosome-associated protein
MDLRKKQRAVVDALEDIKARDIVVLDTARMPSIFERVVIASGDSSRQVRALADSVVKKLKALGAKVGGIEGTGSDWMLVDLGDVVVHVMHPAMRSHYNLEEIWGGKPVRMKTIEATMAAAKKPAPRRKAAPANKPAAPRKRAARKPSAA